MLGQAVGLPLFMALFSFVGVAVTSATVAMYGSAVSDPIVLLGMQRNRIAMALGLLGVAVATLTTNVAANVVGPANALVNLNPQRISFTTGGVVTALLGMAMRPWKLIESSQVYRTAIRVWLVSCHSSHTNAGFYLYVADRLVGGAGAHWRHRDCRLLHHQAAAAGY